jgi:tetratricopeptide (TPR) repeat protein
VVQRLFSPPAEAAPIAFASALLVLVHPLATEAVTYLSGRAALLSAALSLLSIERWLAWRERGEAARGRVPWGSLAAFALALLAKETAAILPAALALVDLWRARQRARSEASPVRFERRAYLFHLLVLALFLAAAAGNPTYRAHLAHSLALRAPLENLRLQPRVALEALALYVAPWRLNIDHDLDPGRLGEPLPAAVAALLLAALAGGALVAFRRGSPAGFGLAWFLLHLLPTASLVARNDLLSERNLYLPSVGLALAAAGAARALARRLAAFRWPAAGRAVFAAVAIGGLGALGALTVQRNALYADPVALWRDAVAKSPGKARPHANLGWSLEVAGRLDAAIVEYRIALRLDPADAVTREHLQRAWERKRRLAVEDAPTHLNAPVRRPADRGRTPDRRPRAPRSTGVPCPGHAERRAARGARRRPTAAGVRRGVRHVAAPCRMPSITSLRRERSGTLRASRAARLRQMPETAAKLAQPLG